MTPERLEDDLLPEFTAERLRSDAELRCVWLAELREVEELRWDEVRSDPTEAELRWEEELRELEETEEEERLEPDEREDEPEDTEDELARPPPVECEAPPRDPPRDWASRGAAHRVIAAMAARMVIEVKRFITQN